MDSVRQLVRDCLTATGLTMAEASKRIGRNHAYLQQFLERGVPAVLPEDVRERLALILGITSDQLRRTSAGSGTFRAPRSVKPLFQPRGEARKMPVLGMAEGGPNGAFEWNGQVVEYIDPPPFLASAVDAYAVYVKGESMSPRYEPGELLYVHPGRPVTPGCYVLVQTKPQNGEQAPLAFLKRLVRRTATKLVLEQLNPHRQIELPVEQIVTIHRIVGSGEP